MKPYFIKTPFLLKQLYKRRLWDMGTSQKSLYLTFDDGPTPGVTPWVLEQLRKYDAKATFFCIGKNIKNHPLLYRQILEEGHSVGNHTNNHPNGWKTQQQKYLRNIEKAQKQIDKHLPENARKSIIQKNLFRPPYGKMTSAQAKEVLNRGYEIVMWDVLSADFDQSISTKKCTRNVLKHAKAGSIIIFHDSIKAEYNLKAALPKTLEKFSKKNFQFKAL